MQENSTREIYDRQSSVYDWTFGRLVRRRVKTAVSHVNLKPTDRVLDIGIGTGASLNYYPPHGRIYGIDLSGGMLRKCTAKIQERQINYATIFQADALRLPFADNAFDHVFISHVVSVVSDPKRLLSEVQRVAKPGTRIVILNHFQSTNRFIAFVEKILCPMFTKLGWRSDLALADLIRGTGVEVEYRFKLGSIDLWETVVILNNKSLMKPQREAESAFPGLASAVDLLAAGPYPAIA